MNAWAQSLMSRLGLREKYEGSQTQADDFSTYQLQFLEKIKMIVIYLKISDTLVFNLDQTGIELVPASDWTMAEEGSKQVEVCGWDDKHEITALLTAMLYGQLQLLSAGKTPRYHPRLSFKSGWDIYLIPTHWSTEDTMLYFVLRLRKGRPIWLPHRVTKPPVRHCPAK